TAGPAGDCPVGLAAGAAGQECEGGRGPGPVDGAGYALTCWLTAPLTVSRVGCCCYLIWAPWRNPRRATRVAGPGHLPVPGLPACPSGVRGAAGGGLARALKPVGQGALSRAQGRAGLRLMVFTRSSGLMKPTMLLALPGWGWLRMWPFILPMMCISQGLQSNLRVSTSS